LSKVAVKCEELTKRYAGTIAVDAVSFSVLQGEILSIVGPSSGGKTTTIRMLAGFEQPDSGEISLHDTLVSSSSIFIPPERRNVGIVFQEYALFPNKTVAENVAFGLHRLQRNERHSRLSDVMEMVQISDVSNSYPHEISGGQQQRVALARSLAPQPDVLLLDEPFSNLDTGLRVEIRNEVRNILRETQTTTVFVTHDQEEAMFMGDILAVMSKGRIQQIGDPAELYHSPSTRFVASFLGNTDFLHGIIVDSIVRTELGEIPAPKESYPGHIDLVLRPQDLVLGEGPGEGTVEGSEFRGATCLHHIRLVSGDKVRVETPVYLRSKVGDEVKVGIGPHYRAVGFPSQ
tara:strand:- start:70 stop:1107 length:1038 start_codon:yes stop_codon:yes gene_type:complete